MSELRGVLWESYTGDAIFITQAVWERFTTQPKTRASKAAVPVISPLKKILDEWRLQHGNPTTGLIFASGKGTPLNLNNLLNRVILPTLRTSGVGDSFAWHHLRRGVATIMHDLGVDDHTIKTILRHSDVKQLRAVTSRACLRRVSMR